MTTNKGGRPRLIPGEETKIASVRLPVSLMEKFKALGGIKWMREAIRNARIKP